MTQFEQEQKAKQFVEKWTGKGDEKSDTQRFWLSLLNEVYGIEDPMQYIEFEKRVRIENKSFIDGYIPSTKVLIEQKSITINLDKKERQSDGSELTPYGQAKRYNDNLDYTQRARWIITCNFKEFKIYDMDKIHSDPITFKLEELPKLYYLLQFLVDSKDIEIQKEEEVSFKAGVLVGKLYDEILKLYIDPTKEETLKSLNVLCVRLVFCLYAEDAGLFGKHNIFHDFIAEFKGEDLREELLKLFEVLNTPVENRDPYLKEIYAQFPYVNGGLFENENIEIPRLNDDIKNLLMNEASADFDWSEISPTIFGAVFESTLNPETRRSGGMHYTSIQNIHKVIDPLFLDELKYELDKIIAEPVFKTRKKKLLEYQQKLANLKFLDPACGSGNFLTETYLSIRKLENRAIAEYMQGQVQLGDVYDNPIKVSINQFYGIEINDFAVTVAKTALWIAEAQMFYETLEIIHMNQDFLPLKTYTHITEGNALRIDWNDVVNKEELNYIMGNPPFVGSKYSSAIQKSDMDIVYSKYKNSKYRTLDYVSCWYVLASEYIKNTNIKCAFVSTNSICQGEQTEILWRIMFENKVRIIFAYKTFRWDSEASIKAHVHCIIIGFDTLENKIDKYIYNNNNLNKCNNINAYLISAPNIFIKSRNKPFDKRKSMIAPNKPCDYNNLKIEKDEYNEFVTKCPQSRQWIKKMVGAQEFINNKERYCLWLVNCSPNELRSMPLVIERVNKCREDRIKANTAESLKLAETPTLFREQINPEQYLLIPCVSSERRKYIPIGFLDGETIPVMGTLIIPNADIYDFGILTSNVHMAWTRVVCGRLKSDYRYSKDIVYNNFPWCNPTDEQKQKIEKTAQEILDARALYPDSSLSDLYDPLTMPKELRKAHIENDKAVMEAYGFDYKTMSEDDCVAELMKMYQEITK